jgi:hypothetical protein
VFGVVLGGLNGVSTLAALGYNLQGVTPAAGLVQDNGVPQGLGLANCLALEGLAAEVDLARGLPDEPAPSGLLATAMAEWALADRLPATSPEPADLDHAASRDDRVSLLDRSVDIDRIFAEMADGWDPQGNAELCRFRA